MISNLTKLKKMMIEKPWLYEEEEHAVVKLAEDAIDLITTIAEGMPADDMDGTPADAETWLKEHK